MSAVAVIGGGVAGLVAARELALAGHDVSLYEAVDQVGGMVRGVELAGVMVDSGAEAYATRTDDVAILCAELGLEVAGPFGRSHVWWPDRGKFPLASGLLGIPGDIDDAAMAVLTRDERERAARDLTDPVGELGESVADVVTARLGEAVLQRLVAPLARGVYNLDPAAMPLARFAPGLLDDMREHGSLVRAVGARTSGKAAVAQPVGGMYRLVTALSDALLQAGGRIHVGHPVSSLAEVSADLVVLTTPAAVTARLLAERGIAFEPPAVGSTRSLLLALEHPGLADDPVGTGILLGERPDGMLVRALTHYSAKWPWARQAGVEMVRVALPPEGDVDLDGVLADCSRLTGLDLGRGQLIDQHEVTWAEMPRVIQQAERERLQEQLDRSGDLRVTGAWWAGNGLAAVVRSAREVAR